MPILTVMEPTFTFTEPLWLHSSGSWVFVTVPVDDSEDIREFAPDGPGFGSVPVRVEIGETSWTTSVFPDKKSGCYVLPVKKPVRTAERVDVGDPVEVTLTVRML